MSVLRVPALMPLKAVVKNDILYLYGGAQSYKLPNTDVESTNNILGFSRCPRPNTLVQL